MANESTATGQASDDGDVHRLRDILVEEVSLVDRAANKRRFLVVKRSNEMSDGPSRGEQPDADDAAQGTAARGRGKKAPKPDPKVGKARRRAAASADDADGDDDEVDAKKATRARPPWQKDDEDDDEDDTEKADDEDEDETEKADEEDDDDDVETKKGDDDDEDGDEDGGAADKARKRAKSDNGAAGRPQRRGKPAEKADDDLFMSPAVKTAVLRVLAQALERLMGVANRVKEAEPPDDDNEAYVPDDITGELEDIGELLEDVAERLPAAKAARQKAGVAKAGARMAKERLDRFQKALALLSDVLKELTNAAQPQEPAGGSAENKVHKRTSMPGVAALVSSVNELTQMMKGQQDELVRLRKTRATSNAIPVDGGRRAASQEVSWPLDMNRPISRDGVAKAVSFFDEP